MAAISFLLSMIMSNTATSAMMLALIGPLLATRPPDDRYAATLVLAVPAGANLGGMSSLVGTPPNAIAAALLAERAGTEISFAAWFGIGLPPALIMAAALVTVLVLRVPRGVTGIGASLDALPAATPAPRWEVVVVALTLTSTLTLWLTQDLHGLPTPVVAVVPVVLFTATGILSVDGFRNLSWDVLFLLAGGLVLGKMLVDTGLADWLVAGTAAQTLSPLAFVFAAGATTVVLSNVMSNTAAANVLVPLVLSASAGAAGAGTTAALAVALCASTAMALPVATPPNALAYASGRLRTRDFLLLGGVAGVLGPLVANGLAELDRGALSSTAGPGAALNRPAGP